MCVLLGWLPQLHRDGSCHPCSVRYRQGRLRGGGERPGLVRLPLRRRGHLPRVPADRLRGPAPGGRRGRAAPPVPGLEGGYLGGAPRGQPRGLLHPRGGRRLLPLHRLRGRVGRPLRRGGAAALGRGVLPRGGHLLPRRRHVGAHGDALRLLRGGAGAAAREGAGGPLPLRRHARAAQRGGDGQGGRRRRGGAGRGGRRRPEERGGGGAGAVTSAGRRVRQALRQGGRAVQEVPGVGVRLALRVGLRPRPARPGPAPSPRRPLAHRHILLGRARLVDRGRGHQPAAPAPQAGAMLAAGCPRPLVAAHARLSAVVFLSRLARRVLRGGILKGCCCTVGTRFTARVVFFHPACCTQQAPERRGESVDCTLIVYNHIHSAFCATALVEKLQRSARLYACSSFAPYSCHPR
mmetsp:Transcript_128128/g.362734  ORF Transcript_128128/g.362734 Transcript_128128/m.362734 type:complete len:407 (-) Transcript_128128:9-1229(-)